MDARSRDILKGQCLNIVFNSLQWWQISNKETRDKAVEDALVLFKELENKGYYNW